MTRRNMLERLDRTKCRYIQSQFTPPVIVFADRVQDIAEKVRAKVSIQQIVVLEINQISSQVV